jgi:hypothetical protein
MIMTSSLPGYPRRVWDEETGALGRATRNPTAPAAGTYPDRGRQHARNQARGAQAVLIAAATSVHAGHAGTPPVAAIHLPASHIPGGTVSSPASQVAMAAAS